jgi:hypothetical protein
VDFLKSSITPKNKGIKGRERGKERSEGKCKATTILQPL